MNILIANMKWVMLVCGALTLTMLYAAIDPQAALTSNFGETLEGPVAEIVVRNWGALIAIVGGMLIFGAFDPPSRPLVLTVASLGKLTFIGLVLGFGSPFLRHGAGTAVVFDLVMVLLFAGYLIGTRGSRSLDARSSRH